MAGSESPSGFEIDGEVYEVPRLDSFNMDEAQILYDLSGIVIEDFIPPHPDESEAEKAAVLKLQLIKVRNPGFRRALIVVSYLRQNPDASFEDVNRLAGGVNAVDVTLAVLNRGDDDEVDPSTSSPKPLSERNDTSAPSEPSSSGNPSGSVSAGQVVSLARTGTSESDTSSQASREKVSAS